MKHIDIHEDETGQTTRIGTSAEFVDLFIAEMGSIATVVLKSEMRKKAVSALDRIMQKAQDGR